jgi:hypothetical protein
VSRRVTANSIEFNNRNKLNFKVHNLHNQNNKERDWIDSYSNISLPDLEKIKRLSLEERLPYLRATYVSDQSLINLYMISMRYDDLVTGENVKLLLSERGYQIPK